MEVAIATTLFGAVVNLALPEVVNRIKNKKNKEKVKASADSIKENINIVSYKVQRYQENRKDTSLDWQNKIAQWRHLLCDIEDCIDTFNINNEDDRGFATKMEAFKKDSMTQSEEIETYIRDHKKLPSDSLQGQPDSPDNHPGGNLVGMEQPTRDILALVLRKFKKQVEAAKAAGSNLKVTKVISIVGSRGVGKTCLASQVYHHPRLPISFSLHTFVSATGKDTTAVIEEVLRELHLMVHGASVCTEQDPRACLRSANERCFIVVDDVHDLELGIGVIEEFRGVTKVDSIIILTTTVQSFAQKWSCPDGHVYKMMPLSAQLSRTLFAAHCGHAAVPESKDFGVGCDDGVPLAVITWAGYCKYDSQTCKTVWSKFGHWESSSRLERMERVLKHSYDSLADDSLQTCLLYFSLFRPENGVRPGSLVRRWQAEGAEVGCSDNRNQSMGNWKTLVDRNVLCPIQVSINEEDQGAKTCRASGAMLGYILSHNSRSEEGFARVCGDELCLPPLIRRLSLQAHKAEDLNAQDLSRLRTLVVSSENKNGTKAADLNFKNCGLLRVLDLEAYGGRVKVEHVCNKLKLLRYLSLGSASIVDDFVPQEIKELKELETLDVGKEKVVVVHVDVLLLPKLKHLLGKIQLQTSLQFQANPEMFKAEKLETLAGFVTQTAKGFPAVMKYMSKLRKVKVFFHPEANADCLSSRHNFWRKLSYPLADAITAFLDETSNHHRRSLSLDVKECEQPTNVLGSLENAEGKLHSLKLCTSELDSLPSFIAKNKLKCIEKLCISFHQKKGQQVSHTKLVSSCQAIIDYGQLHLPALKYLKLVVEGTFPGILLIKKDKFENLERICIQSTELLPKLQIEDEALTKLVSLHLISKNIGEPTSMMCNSSKAKKIPQLKNLKEVALRSSSPVGDDIKKAWHMAARVHPNSPQVLFSRAVQ